MFLNRLFLATALGLSSVLTLTHTASAQSAFSSYFVGHDFTVNFGGNNQPNLLGGFVSGSAQCRSPFSSDFDSYQYLEIDTTPALAVNIPPNGDSATAICSGANAFASSFAKGEINNNILTGITIARGQAFATSPPGGSATARSYAALTAGQLGVNPFGRVTWRPLFSSVVSGSASAFALARPRDPITYSIKDPTTNKVLYTGKLLDIQADFDGLGSQFEWGAPAGFKYEGELPVDSGVGLNVRFTNNGTFKIDLSDSAVVNPGLLDLECQAGTITRATTNGRFAGWLPDAGTICDFTVPKNLFTPTLDFQYDFSQLPSFPATEVNLEFDLGGDGFSHASVPEPGLVLGLLSFVSGIFATKRKQETAK